ncbi:hypothetical protein PT974_03965 [Cladobotryum mycophilum]|uniref:Uncharacterized protein n=1 Tax=Cladobotryum mycophilum TaxID=491253 RepID=A0ABR0STV1_9HYPO
MISLDDTQAALLSLIEKLDDNCSAVSPAFLARLARSPTLIVVLQSRDNLQRRYHHGASYSVALPLAVVLESSIGSTSDFFPFQDLASIGKTNKDDFSFKDLIKKGIGGDQDITLFSSGCLIDGVNDCPRACNDTETLFGSLETFYNCAALSSIAHLTRDAKTYYVSGRAEMNASSIMGTSSLYDFDYKPVLDSFISCAQAACGSDQLSVACDESIKRLSPSNSSADDVFDAMDVFCPDIPAQIDPDIFGPGVLISYVLQVCFSTSLYISVQAFTYWVRYSQKLKARGPYTLSRARSLVWRDSSTISRTSIAIATTLVEFQEAQCWFVFALQIASILAIVVNSQEGAFWGEIIVNGAVAYHISLNGILPMFLVQVCLHNEGIRNWHTFLGFAIEYFLAIVSASQKISFKASFEIFRTQNAIDACGGNPSPRTYCASTQGVAGLHLSFFPHPLLYKIVFLLLDSTAFLVLLIDQLSWTLRKHRRTKHMVFGNWEPGRWPHNGFRARWQKISKLFWRGLEVAYFLINILYMISLSKVISAKSFQANRWSYGQIIAITVWGPLIVKLFDLIIAGPPKNGEKEDSGPPRLRIDNEINHRLDEEKEDGEQLGQEMTEGTSTGLDPLAKVFSRQGTGFSRQDTLH